MGKNGNANNPIVRVRNLTKSYNPDCESCAVLENVSFDIEQGEFLVMLGVSGSGKSTLLNLVSGLDRADQGKVWIKGTEITTLSEHDRTVFRRDAVGFVFQFFNLIPTLTVLENVAFPLELQGVKRKMAELRARELLDRVGLISRGGDFPDRLSGGEQQRVAIARALVHEPALVLADEPTGNLDEDTGQHVLSMLLELTREAGKTLVMATHNPEIVPLADRVCRIQDSNIQFSVNSRLLPNLAAS